MCFPLHFVIYSSYVNRGYISSVARERLSVSLICYVTGTSSMKEVNYMLVLEETTGEIRFVCEHCGQDLYLEDVVDEDFFPLECICFRCKNKAVFEEVFE